MERLSLLLLSATAIAAIQICSTLAQSGSEGNDASEEFSGSGTGDSSCYIPASSNLNHGRMNLTEEELEDVMMEGRCYLACTADEDYMSTVTTKRNRTTMFYWPYSVVEEGCITTQKIHECVRGCVAKFGSSRASGRRCSTPCFEKCSDECNKTNTGCTNPDPQDPWIHPQCTVDCEESPCRSGCTLNLVVNETERLPWNPVGSPAVNPISNAAWQFTIDLSQASPKPSRGHSSISVAPVAFLLRIELTSSQTFSFKWAAEPFMQLDLADYACQEIRISFAVTNRVGLSQFSDPVHIIVDGVHPPRNLQVLSVIDTRIGFFGYASLNISWEPPQNDVFLDYYSITISSNTVTCTREWSQSLISNDTFIVVMGTMGTPFPQTNCTYEIQVSSVGPAGNSEPISEMHHTPEFDPKNIGFQCKRLWDSQKYFFSFNFTWTLPDYLRYGGIILDFQIKYGMTGISQKLKKTIPHPQNSSAVFSEIISPNDTGIDGRPYNTPRPNSMGVAFLFEMNVIWTRAHSPAPYTYNCTASTLSPAPTVIENITMESYCFSSDTQVTLSFHWKPPSNFNGEPSNYTACLGTHPLNPTEDINPIPEGHFCTSHSLLPELSNATVTLLHVRISSHLYFQMRASNEFVSGNWSEAYEIPLSSMGTSSASTSSTSAATVGITVGSKLATSTSSTSAATIGIIVGSMVGGVALIILLMCCTCVTIWYVKMLRQRKKLRRITEDVIKDPMFTGKGSKIMYMRNPTDMSLKSPMDEWEIPANEVIMEKQLGEGAFGEVYKGIIKCPIVNPKVRPLVENAFCTPVAIKLLKLSAKGNERKDFLSEIEMMKKVAEGQNPHVVGLLGCVTIQEPLCLITEFVKYGDLLSYLRTNRRMCTETNTEEDDENDAYLELGNVSPVDLISFSYQIASGMEYLSSLGIVHRDLASRNILVDEGKVLKITDFGMSRETDEIYVQKRTGRVPLKWMAIESIIAREFTSASDVWSFGITLWEIGTLGGFPYPSIQNEDLLLLLKGGYRMEKPDNCSPEVYEIMLMCWNEHPQKRPKFTELRAKFDAMLAAEGKDAYIDLRIDSDKPYYRLDTSATMAAANGVLHLSPNPNRHSFMPNSPGSGIDSRSGSKECSPNPLHTPNLSPNRKSSPQASCCSSAHGSPRKLDFGGGAGGNNNIAAVSVSSFGRQSPNHNMRERTQTLVAGNGERRGEHSRENGRPLSLLLPRDRGRERRERQNPYVDEPSRVAQASMLAAPLNGDTRRGSDGAIEMGYLRNDGPQSQGAGIEIKITSEKN